MSNFLICRIENYKMGQATGVDIEIEHLAERGYNNPDWDKTKTHENISLEHDSSKDGKTFPQYIKDYREEHNIQGRMTTSGKEKSQTNVLTQCVITASPEYMDSLSRSEQIDFFKTGLKSFKEMYPSYHIVDARIHFDEKSPHLQINSLPIYYNKEKDILQFSTTETQKGRYHYREFQDHMFDRMSKTYNIERGISSEERKIKHQDKDTWERLQEKEKQLDSREQALDKREQEFNKQIQKYREAPLPQKTIFGKGKISPEDSERLQEQRNAAYAKYDQMKQERDTYKAVAGQSEVDKERLQNKLHDLQEKQLDRDYLKQQLKEADRIRQEEPEHTRSRQKDKDFDINR